MHAVRLTQTNATLVDAELDDPVADGGEVLVDIRAAGICHSDAHYRAGRGSIALPLTLGHEIAGVNVATGERVALHYLLPNGDMLGKERDGGYAQRIVVPAENAVPIPDGVSFEHAAVMMCSTATAWHALRLSRIERGESLAILGFGGLGVSALQLARTLGVEKIYAVDIVPEKLAMAEHMGAIAVSEPPRVDVALDFAGHAATSAAALRALNFGGRLMIVAINLRSLELDPYRDVLAWQRQIIGVSDHTRDELVEVLDLAARGAIDLSSVITRRVPLRADAIEEVLDDIDRGTTHLRTVIV
ncbi:MAG TPA: zinc-binding dehydrogenase [Thermoanaerobaculia bacterium]|nr:zinc-binding dehydrogenase [Thermoanaerobaculia bacterium]